MVSGANKRFHFSFNDFKAKHVKWRKISARLWLHPVKITDFKSVPIIINNRNRLAMMLELIDSLTSRGYHNIFIIDNASTYRPLLDWYIECPYPVFLLHENVGHLSLWKTGLYKMFWNSYYAYTDSDILLHEDCPDDFMEKFVGLLKKYPSALKVGFSLSINDLPDCFAGKQSVIEHESQFWKKELEPGVYDAPIDTTFAVYKPYFKGEFIDIRKRYIRTAPPYTARHQPWYIDSAKLSEEEEYYVSHLQTVTHWSQMEMLREK